MAEWERYFKKSPRSGGQEGGVLSDRKEAADQEIEDMVAGCQERLLNTALSTSHRALGPALSQLSSTCFISKAASSAEQRSDVMSIIMSCHCYFNKSGYF